MNLGLVNIADTISHLWNCLKVFAVIVLEFNLVDEYAFLNNMRHQIPLRYVQLLPNLFLCFFYINQDSDLLAQHLEILRELQHALLMRVIQVHAVENLSKAPFIKCFIDQKPLLKDLIHEHKA